MLGELFKGIADEVGAAFDDLRPDNGTRTITVAKPYCMPARPIVLSALQPYGVKIYDYTEIVKTVSPLYAIKNMTVRANAIEQITRMMDPLPTAQVAEVVVSAKAAAWAEYLLIRTKKLYRIGRYIEPKNEAWAQRHGGQMPPAWNDNKPWIESGCSKGMAAWGPLRKAAKKGKQ